MNIVAVRICSFKKSESNKIRSVKDKKTILTLGQSKLVTLTNNIKLPECFFFLAETVRVEDVFSL